MTLVPADPDTAAAAAMLTATGWLSTPAEVCDFFGTPAKWQPQVAVWTAAGSPTPDDAGWELFLRRLATLE